MATMLIGPNAGRAQIAESARVHRELAELRAENEILREENETLRALVGVSSSPSANGNVSYATPPIEIDIGPASAAVATHVPASPGHAALPKGSAETIERPAPEAAPTSVIESLRGIAVESSVNAAAQPIGSLASGERRAVGFSTADGYLRALAQGVKLATADLYRAELRRMYGYSAAQIAALKITIIADNGRPVGPGIVHAARGPSYADMTPHQRVAQRRVGTPVAPAARPFVASAPRVLAGPTARGPAQIPGVTALSAPFVNKDGCTVQLITRPPPGGPPQSATPQGAPNAPQARQLAAGATQRSAPPPPGSTFTSPDGSSVKLMGPAIGRGAAPTPGVRAAPRIQLSAPASQAPPEHALAELVDGPPPGLESSGDDTVDRFSLLELD